MAEASGFGAAAGGLAARSSVPAVSRPPAPWVRAAAPTLAVMEPGAAGGSVRLLLRIEGVALLALAAGAYAQFGASWGFFVLMFLVPDLSLLAYLAGPRAGAAAYNAAHSLLTPALLLALGLVANLPMAFDLALIWTAHIGLDRALGFGLKYASGFAHTHLGRLGPADPW